MNRRSRLFSLFSSGWMKLGAGGVLSAAGLWYALKNVAWTDVRAAWPQDGRALWLFAVPLGVGAEYLARTLRWGALVSALRTRAGGSLWPVVAGAMFLNNVLPFRAGEVYRVAATARRTGGSLATAAGAAITDRLLDVAAVACFGVWGGALLLSPDNRLRLALLPLALLFVPWIVRSRPFIVRAASALPLVKKAVPFLDRLMSGADALGDWRTFAGAGFATALLWVSVLVALKTSAAAFGLALSWMETAGLTAGLCLGVMVPAAPGFIGTFEASGVAVLTLMGRSPEQSAVFLLTYHALQIASSALWGAPGLLLGGNARAREAMPAPGAA